MRAPLCQTWSSKPLDQGNSYNNNSTPKTWKGRVDKSFCWDTAWFAWGITLSSQGVSAVVIVSWHLLASVHSTAWLGGFPRSLMCVQSSMILMGQCISSYSKVINVGSSVAGSFWETCQILKMTSSSYFYCTKNCTAGHLPPCSQWPCLRIRIAYICIHDVTHWEMFFQWWRK